MSEIVDFSKFNSNEEALDAWLVPSLSIKVGINMPANLQPPPPQPEPATLNQYEDSPPPQPPQESSSFPRLDLDLLNYDQHVRSPDPTTAGAMVHRPSVRARRTVSNEDETIAPPFPWATNRRAKVHSLEYLLANGLTMIRGEIQCRRCERKETMSYDLQAKFREVESFVRARMHLMHERAPTEWMNPVFAECTACMQPNCMRPVLAEGETDCNWLFMFLGQSLGVCTLSQLKWFCKHTQNHRTGAKDRVLYLTYIAIGKQLDPNGVFRV